MRRWWSALLITVALGSVLAVCGCGSNPSAVSESASARPHSSAIAPSRSTLAGGHLFSVGIKPNGTLWAWGDNTFGELGLGDHNDRSAPTQVGSDSDWTSVSAGGGHSLALKRNRTLWAWGDNSMGKLGLGDDKARAVPSQVGSDADWTAANAHLRFSVALESDGTLWSWGSNQSGQLGLGQSGVGGMAAVPTRVGKANDWQSAAGSWQHVVARRRDGTLWAWGFGYDGQLGLGGEGRSAGQAGAKGPRRQVDRLLEGAAEVQ